MFFLVIKWTEYQGKEVSFLCLVVGHLSTGITWERRRKYFRIIAIFFEWVFAHGCHHFSEPDWLIMERGFLLNNTDCLLCNNGSTDHPQTHPSYSAWAALDGNPETFWEPDKNTRYVEKLMNRKPFIATFYFYLLLCLNMNTFEWKEAFYILPPNATPVRDPEDLWKASNSIQG